MFRIFGGSDDDEIIGSDESFRLEIQLGAGNDIVVGGLGHETLQYHTGNAGQALNISSLGINMETGFARGLLGSEFFRHRFSDIEAVVGSRSNDNITGSRYNDEINGVSGDDTIKSGSGDDSINGGLGSDSIMGQAGNDQLNGGTGADTLVGGAGSDRLTGGAGADDFIYRSIAETGKTGTTRDTITDFQRGIDDIDLRAIDANTARTGNQAFSFIGSGAFTGTAGQLRFANGLVSGDVNGDRVADFTIEITGVSALGAGDLIL